MSDNLSSISFTCAAVSASSAAVVFFFFFLSFGFFEMALLCFPWHSFPDATFVEV